MELARHSRDWHRPRPRALAHPASAGAAADPPPTVSKYQRKEPKLSKVRKAQISHIKTIRKKAIVGKGKVLDYKKAIKATHDGDVRRFAAGWSRAGRKIIHITKAQRKAISRIATTAFATSSANGLRDAGAPASKVKKCKNDTSMTVKGSNQLKSYWWAIG